jgi:hypothetical protein
MHRDMKGGGQNVCISKDPLYYLPQKETILPCLYPGDYLAVANASKQFYNLKTKSSECLLLGYLYSPYHWR